MMSTLRFVVFVASNTIGLLGLFALFNNDFLPGLFLVPTCSLLSVKVWCAEFRR